MNLMKSVLS